jgi:hypothetical protein
MAEKCFVVLGISHKVQGAATFPGAFHDPSYALVLRDIISKDRIDFVGEEGDGKPTVAEKVTEELLGIGHHRNVDPLPEEQEKCGIGETYCGPGISELPVDRWIVAENDKRERIWAERLVEGTANKGLLVCGFLHAFSVATRLLKQGFEVEARTYGLKNIGPALTVNNWGHTG